MGSKRPCLISKLSPIWGILSLPMTSKFAASLEEADTENEEDADEAAKEELEQIKSALEEEDGSSKIMQTPTAVPATKEAATPAPEASPPKKKRPGRPPKNKKKES